MSWLMSDGAPSEFGAASATPAPCTRTIAATASAPVTRLNEKSPRSGRCGTGMPRGISPASPTLATLSAPARITTTVGTTSALTMAMRVRASTTKITSEASPVSSEASPVSSEATSMPAGWMTTLTALASGKAPWASAPVRSAT